RHRRQHMRPSRETSTASLIPPNAQFSQRPTSISSFNSVANLDHAYQIAGTVRSTPSAASLAKLNAFTLSPDPSQWGSRVAMHETEPDDDLQCVTTHAQRSRTRSLRSPHPLTPPPQQPRPRTRPPHRPPLGDDHQARAREYRLSRDSAGRDNDALVRSAD
ncbi:hypothetical protein GGG16DRAFT_92707, partial [Schizophyllum commune]